MSLQASKLRPAYDAIKTLVNISGSQGLLFDAAGGALRNGRTSTATIKDFEGIIRNCKVGEIRYANARRVENLFNNSALAGTVGALPTDWAATGIDITNKVSSEPGVVNFRRIQGGYCGMQQSNRLVIGRTYRVRVGIRRVSGVTANDLSLYLATDPGTNTIASATTIGAQAVGEWVHYSLLFSASTASISLVSVTGATGQGYDLTMPLLEDVSSQAIQSPSRYIDSATIYNAGVPGVKYFYSVNGNTMVGNVITEADGAFLNPMPAILHEGGSTNLLPYSTAFSNAGWSYVQGVALTNSTSQDSMGGNTAALITVGAASSTHAFVGPFMNFVAGVVYTLSISIKPNTYDLIQVAGTSNAFGSGQYVNFRLSGDGTITASSGVLNATITPEGFGYYRCTVTVTATITASAPGIAVIFIDSPTSGRAPAYVGNGVDSLYFCNPQTEIGNYATSYIPTTTTAVTRAADNIKLPYVPDGNLLDQSGFILMKFVYGVGPSDNDQNKGIFTTDGSGPIYKFGTSGGTVAYKDKSNNGNVPWSIIPSRDSTLFIALIWSLREGFTMSASVDGDVWQHDTTQPFKGMPPGSFLELFKDSGFTHQLQMLKVFSGLPGKTLQNARTWIETNAFAQVQ